MIKFKDMKLNRSCCTYALVEQVSTATTTTNKKYLNLKLSDGEESMSAKRWNHSGEVPMMGSIIFIQATLGEYLGAKQLTIDDWRNISDKDAINPNDFKKRSPYTKEDFDKRFNALISGIADSDYQLITQTIYNEFKDDFLEAPAALKHHQNYIGGLAEHTLGVVTKALALADPTTNASLLCAGAILHDIGKIFTYDWSGMAITMTDRGKLLDHIVIGEQILQYATIRFNFQEPTLQASSEFRNKLLMLQHIIASHHGKQEYGSPVTPHLKEAFIIHEADAADATESVLNSVLDKTENSWTEYQSDLKGDVLKFLPEDVPQAPFNILKSNGGIVENE